MLTIVLCGCSLYRVVSWAQLYSESRFNFVVFKTEILITVIISGGLSILKLGVLDRANSAPSLLFPPSPSPDVYVCWLTWMYHYAFRGAFPLTYPYTYTRNLKVSIFTVTFINYHQKIFILDILTSTGSKMVNGSRYYRALESVSIASALSTALTIYPGQIRVHQRWQSKLQLPTARKKECRPATADSLPQAVTCQHWYTLL